jgi:hypothetical protein
MNIRNIAAAGFVLAGLGVGAVAVTSAPAHASGTVVSKVSEVKTIVNSKCYNDVRVTTSYYHHSSVYGWVLYPSPKVTTTKSEHCYK